MRDAPVDRRDSESYTALEGLRGRSPVVSTPGGPRDVFVRRSNGSDRLRSIMLHASAYVAVFTLIGLKRMTTRVSPGRSIERRSAPYFAPSRSAKT